MATTQEKDLHYLRTGYFKVGGFALRIATTYSLNLNISIKEKFAFWTQSVIHLAALITGWIVAIQTVKIYGDISSALEFLHLLFGATVLWVQTINFIVKRKSMEHMMIIIGKDFYNYPNEDMSMEWQLKKKTLDWYVKFWKFCLITTGFVLVLYAFRSAYKFIFFADQIDKFDLTKSAHPFLPLKMYYPIDLNKPNNLLLAIIHQLIFIALSVFVLNAQATVYIRFIGSLVAEFRVLSHSIDRIENRIHNLCKQNIKIENVDNKILYKRKFNEYSIACLKNNVIHHQLLLNFFISLQNIHGFDLSAAFLVAVIVLCFGSFMILAGFNSTVEDTLVTICLLCMEMTNIFFLCYLSEELEIERLQFCDSLQFMSWYNMSPKFKKMLTIINDCNKKQFLLRTNTGVTASRETFQSILTSAYSYVNVLREFFGK